MNQESAEVTEPQNMSKEDFEAYLRAIAEGSGEADESADDEAIENPDGEVNEPEETPINDAAKKTFTQEDVNRIVTERLARERAKESKSKNNSPLAQEALRFYGGDNEESAMEALLNDLKAQNADRMNVSPEEYEAHSQIEEKARLYDEAQKKASDEENEVNAIRERWERESQELKTIVSDFDFVREMAANESFKQAILNGKSVALAYIQSRGSEKQRRRGINQNARSSDTLTSSAQKDASRLPTDKFLEYIRKIEQGE